MRAFFIALIMFLWAAGAHAQDGSSCFATADLKQQLLEKYKESVVWQGITSQGQGLIQVYADGDQTTFTVVITASVDGEQTSCLLGHGKAWMMLSPLDTEEGPKT